MNNWHRNRFALDHTTDVPMDSHLVVVETDGASAMPADVPVTWMEAVGLDKSVQRRRARRDVTGDSRPSCRHARHPRAEADRRAVARQSLTRIDAEEEESTCP